MLIKGQAGVAADIELVYCSGTLTGDEKANYLSYLLGLDQFGRVDVWTHLFHHLCSHSARADKMYPDPERLNFLGEHLREPGQGVLR